MPRKSSSPAPTLPGGPAGLHLAGWGNHRRRSAPGADPSGRLPAALGRSLSDGCGGSFSPEGYTLTRAGCNQHWRFYRQAETGYLGLTLETVAQLPETVYDVFIDVGHGGADAGAVGHGLVEAEQNLLAALYLKEQLVAMGLKVALSRDSMDLPGGQGGGAEPLCPWRPYRPSLPQSG